MIAIIDYGMGNLRSVEKAFHKLGHPAAVTSDPAEIRQAVGGGDGVVVPVEAEGLQQIEARRRARRRHLIGDLLPRRRHRRSIHGRPESLWRVRGACATA